MARPTDVLAVVAHPDDTEFMFGGSVAALRAAGSRVRYLIVTTGDAGEESSRRIDEQRRAAAALGVTSVDYLDRSDGEVVCDTHLREEICHAVRSYRPALVLTHFPEFNYRSIRFSHPDHMAVGKATIHAVYPDARTDGRYRHQLDERRTSHFVEELWLTGAPTPNHYVDISQHMDEKIAACRCHESQVGAFGDVDAYFREWAQEVAGVKGEDGAMEAFLRWDVR